MSEHVEIFGGSHPSTAVEPETRLERLQRLRRRAHELVSGARKRYILACRGTDAQNRLQAWQEAIHKLCEIEDEHRAERVRVAAEEVV